MSRLAVALTLALVLATGPALAGGEGGSTPFSDKKTPEPGTDPGFDTAAKFFAIFSQAGISPAADYSQNTVNFDKRKHRRRYMKYLTRAPIDPAVERKIAENLNRIFLETKEEFGLASPRTAPNLAPIDDPDALPGLDY